VLRGEVLEQIKSANAGAAHPHDRTTVHTIALAMQRRPEPVASEY
jgi:hypothetical protein